MYQLGQVKIQNKNAQYAEPCCQNETHDIVVLPLHFQVSHKFNQHIITPSFLYCREAKIVLLPKMKTCKIWRDPSHVNYWIKVLRASKLQRKNINSHQSP